MGRIPILRLGPVLIVSVQGDLPDSVAVALRHDVDHQVSSGGVRGVILDVSGVMIVDSYLARVLTEIAADCTLLGAGTVVAGIQPAVAITLVEMGLRLRRCAAVPLPGGRPGHVRRSGPGAARGCRRARRQLRNRAMIVAAQRRALQVRSDVDLMAVREATDRRPPRPDSAWSARPSW